MFQDITYALVLGKPLILYLGLMTLSLFIIAAVIGAMVLKGKAGMKQHKLAVGIAFASAAIHAFLGTMAYF